MVRPELAGDSLVNKDFPSNMLIDFYSFWGPLLEALNRVIAFDFRGMRFLGQSLTCVSIVKKLQVLEVLVHVINSNVDT